MFKSLPYAHAACLCVVLLACQAPDAYEAGRLYVTSGLTDQLMVIDAGDGSFIRALEMDLRPGETDEPHGVALSPDGAFLFATLAHGSPTVWKFTTTDERLVGRLELPTRGASRIGLTPDGQRAFVPDYWRSGQGRVSGMAVIDTHELELIGTPDLCPAPHDAQVDPTGMWVAVACSLSDEIVVLDAVTLEERSRFPAGVDPGVPGSPSYKPLNLVWSPEGHLVFVTLAVAGTVGAFSPDSGIIASTPVGAGPTQIAITSDGGTLVVANRGDGSLSILDARTLAERTRVPLPGAPHPHGVSLDTTGRRAFVSYEGTIESAGGVITVDLESAEVLWRAEVGQFTLGVVFLADQ